MSWFEKIYYEKFSVKFICLGIYILEPIGFYTLLCGIPPPAEIVAERYFSGAVTPIIY